MYLPGDHKELIQAIHEVRDAIKEINMPDPTFDRFMDNIQAAAERGEAPALEILERCRTAINAIAKTGYKVGNAPAGDIDPDLEAGKKEKGMVPAKDNDLPPDGEDALWSLVVHQRRAADALATVASTLGAIAVEGTLQTKHAKFAADSLATIAEASSYLEMNFRVEQMKEDQAEVKPAPAPPDLHEYTLVIDEDGKPTTTLQDYLVSVEAAKQFALDYFRNFNRNGVYHIWRKKGVRRTGYLEYTGGVPKLEASPAPAPRFELRIKDNHSKNCRTMQDRFCSVDDAETWALDYFRNFGRTGSYSVYEMYESGYERLAKHGEGIPF